MLIRAFSVYLRSGSYKQICCMSMSVQSGVLFAFLFFEGSGKIASTALQLRRTSEKY